MNYWRVWVPLIAALCGPACTKQVNVCKADSDCTDVAYPFCDVGGEYGPSGGEKGVCTIVPPDCPIDRCGCSSGATTCDQDQLTVCNLDGKSTTTTACALGCADTQDHCLEFVPSNGLDTALAGASIQPDVVIPDGASISTDTGTISGVTGVSSLIVSQPSGEIRVFVAKSFTFANATITGALPAAFVAANTVTIAGTIDAGAKGATPGPGGRQMFGSCHGTFISAGGGGANADVGGNGETRDVANGALTIGPGGVQEPDLSALVGGCGGGGTGAGSVGGGAGGGAVQIVAGTSIQLVAPSGSNLGGLLTVGGGAGPNTCGGGSAGNVILESPSVDIEGGITANGGGGGGVSGCITPAQDGQPNGARAKGGCYSINGQVSGGTGGNGSTLYGGAGTLGFNTALNTGNVGGGGAAGQVRAITRDGTYVQGSSAIVSAHVVTGVLTLR